MKKNLKEMLTTVQNVGNMDTSADQPLVVLGIKNMNIYEIAKLADINNCPVSVCHAGSDTLCAVSGLGPAIVEAAKEQGRSVVPQMEMVRMNSSYIIKPGKDRVFCYAGYIVDKPVAPQPWEVADKTPIIVDIRKDLAKSQDLFSLFRMQAVAQTILDGWNDESHLTHSLHLVDKLRVSTFRYDAHNYFRNHTVVLITL